MNKERHARKQCEELNREFDALRKKENVSLTAKVQYIICHMYIYLYVYTNLKIYLLELSATKLIHLFVY